MKEEFLKVDFKDFNLNLTPSEIIIFSYLKSLSNLKGFAFPTNEFLFEKFNKTFSLTSIKRTVKKLKEKNLISSEIKTSKVSGSYLKQRKIYINIEQQQEKPLIKQAVQEQQEKPLLKQVVQQEEKPLLKQVIQQKQAVQEQVVQQQEKPLIKQVIQEQVQPVKEEKIDYSNLVIYNNEEEFTKKNEMNNLNEMKNLNEKYRLINAVPNDEDLKLFTKNVLNFAPAEVLHFIIFFERKEKELISSIDNYTENSNDIIKRSLYYYYYTYSELPINQTSIEVQLFKPYFLRAVTN